MSEKLNQGTKGFEKAAEVSAFGLSEPCAVAQRAFGGHAPRSRRFKIPLGCGAIFWTLRRPLGNDENLASTLQHRRDHIQLQRGSTSGGSSLGIS